MSHWDTQGLKPYMRYTIAGGVGYMAENVAYIQAVSSYRTTAAVEGAIKTLEYQMVYNDAAHNNGHRDNILDPYHTGVSIGIAYSADDVYLVEDFTSDYLNWTTPLAMTNTGTVSLSANLSGANGVTGDGIQMVEIFFDATPAQLTSAQLSASPYDSEYTQGIFVAGVVQQGYHISQGTTVTASQWEIGHSSFAITFDLGSVARANGSGYYTLYVEWQSTSGTQVLLTCYTLFVIS